jgi:hypothetical protein
MIDLVQPIEIPLASRRNFLASLSAYNARRMGRGVRMALLVGLAIALGGTIYENEFDCEEAAQHLSDCCGTDPSTIDCGVGCDQVDIDGQKARAILSTSCQELRQDGGVPGEPRCPPR